MYLDWYRDMQLQRKFEERAGMLYGQQKIRGFCHLYIGQEAVSAGTIAALNDDDPIITAYRDHGLALSRGVSADACMAELYGKSTGCSGGKGGSMHYFSKEHNFYGGHGIVGAQVPLGAGIAFADKYQKNKRVTVCFFGDGAMWQGAIHETFNLASLWKIPVVFVCENNGYAMGTSVERAASNMEMYEFGNTYGIPSRPVDGMSVEAVYNEMSAAVEHARKGNGPSFLEVRTYRYKGHSMSDPQKYRSKDEVNEYKKLDPIEQVKATILKNKYATEAAIEKVNDEIKAEVDACVEFAENSPFPDNSEVYKDIYKQEDYPFLMDY